LTRSKSARNCDAHIQQERKSKNCSKVCAWPVRRLLNRQKFTKLIKMWKYINTFFKCGRLKNLYG